MNDVIATNMSELTAENVVSMAKLLDTDVDLAVARSLDVPHLDQFLGIWAMQEEAVSLLSTQVSTMDLAAHITAAQAQPVNAKADPRFTVEAGGIAVIELTGMMTKYGTSLSRQKGGTLGVRRALRLAMDDPAITGVVLRIDSPGGTIAGTVDLADDVERAVAGGRKPVVAFIEDLAASAAFWVASQATRIIANRNAIIGSIGTYAVLRDTSKAAEKAGVIVHIVRSGEFKGTGVPGTPVTDAQLAEFQTTINQINDLFVQAVAVGRKLPVARVRELADGRVHVGANAVDLGLADSIGTFDETLAALPTGRGGGPRFAGEQPGGSAIRTQENETMSVEPNLVAPAEAKTPTPVPVATLKELKTALPKADAEFLVEAAEKQLTVEAAKDAWIARQDEKMSDLRAEREKATQEPKRIGNEPLRGKPRGYDMPLDATGETSDDHGDPVARYDALVRERVANGATRMVACDAVTKAHPELHKAYLLATNPSRAAQRKIEDKYEAVG